MNYRNIDGIPEHCKPKILFNTYFCYHKLLICCKLKSLIFSLKANFQSFQIGKSFVYNQFESFVSLM